MWSIRPLRWLVSYAIPMKQVFDQRYSDPLYKIRGYMIHSLGNCRPSIWLICTSCFVMRVEAASVKTTGTGIEVFRNKFWCLISASTDPNKWRHLQNDIIIFLLTGKLFMLSEYRTITLQCTVVKLLSHRCGIPISNTGLYGPML